VPEQIGGENGEALGERRHDHVPLRRRAGDPVDQQDDRPVARRAVAQAVAMKNDLALARRERNPPRLALSAGGAGTAAAGATARIGAAIASDQPQSQPVAPFMQRTLDDRSLRCARSASRIQRPRKPRPG
jgi:hypothetical protein